MIGASHQPTMGTTPRREPFAVPVPEPDPTPRPRGVASNPVGVRANYLKHVLCCPVGTLFVLTLVSGGAALAVVHHWGWWFIAGVGVLLLFALWRVNRLEVLKGYLLPGVVLKDKPWTVAVYANLSMGPFKHRPALKILRLPLSRMTGGPPKVGDYIPMVATYGLPREDETWGDFWPDAVGCNTFDPAAVAD